LRALSEILRDPSAAVLNADPGDLLPLAVGGYIRDLIGEVHVPVNSSSRARGLTAASCLHQHAHFARRALFVVLIMIEHFELRAEVLLRRVALLAGLTGGAEIVDRSRNRPWIFSGEYSDQLMSS